MMYTYYIGLGSNLGDTREHLLRAVELMNQRIGQVAALSSFYETEPWGFCSVHHFMNAVCKVVTPLQPLDLLEATQQIERLMGRKEKSVGGVYHDRIIDLDLLRCLDDQEQEVSFDDPRLKLPHPLMEQRDFVMNPLRELMVNGKLTTEE